MIEKEFNDRIYTKSTAKREIESEKETNYINKILTNLKNS